MKDISETLSITHYSRFQNMKC